MPKKSRESQASSISRRGVNRLGIIAGIFTLSFGVVALRAFDYGVIQQHSASTSLSSAQKTFERGNIYDRNQTLLATSIRSSSVFADPEEILDPQETAQKLISVFPDLKAEDLLKDFSSKSRFVWIKRHISPIKASAIIDLGLPGIRFKEEERRIYPDANIASHVLGYTNTDGKGIAGIELQYNDQLANGEDITLTIDSRAQYILHDSLLETMKKFSAVAATGIIMDAKTGEIISLASLPDFIPDLPATKNEDSIFNRATLGVYELGSVFKIFNTALALENGMSLDATFDTTKPVRAGGFTINDYHPENRDLSVAEIFEHSSNIGSVRMLQSIGYGKQRPFLEKLGLMEPSKIDLPEVGSPLWPSTWRKINSMTITYGHGIAVSPMQMVSAATATINGGKLVQPHLNVKSNLPEAQQVISPEVSDKMRGLFRLVVQKGTASSADSEGYIVGGKTGTADKRKGRGYDTKSRMSSFFGAFPMHDPKYVIYMIFDEPKGIKETWGYATGGWVAAPAVGNVITQIAPLLNVMPTSNFSPEVTANLSIPETSED